MTDFSPMTDLRGYMTPEQIKKIIESCQSTLELLVVKLLWRTGCRVSELLQLRLVDVIGEEQRIILRTLKVDKHPQRFADIDPTIIALIKKHVGERKVKFIVGDDFGYVAGDIKKNPEIHRAQERARVRLYYMIQRIGKRAGIERVGETKLHPHHFRHSFAVNFVKQKSRKGAGMSVENLTKLQKKLGHTNPMTTAKYLEYSNQEMKEVMEDVFEDD